ncbi:MAG: cell wall-binding repeat-containing protein, partial [Gracilibacteraceae bacterium]|nr:cell wall-binding repeat-containing protein [Gracilibacteraceae bacterium]
MNKRCALSILFIMLLLAASFPAAAADSETAGAESPHFMRYAGETRYGTALAIAQDWSSAGAVVLARGDDFPDALAGAVLAGAPEVGGPLLLTESARLTPGVMDEIQRLGASTVYLLGGSGAITDGVAAELSAAGLTVERVEGENRFATAAAIARKAVSFTDRVFLAAGYSFADSLSISSFAAARGAPLLLTETDSLPPVTLDAIAASGAVHVTLVGGEGVISPAVADELTSAGYFVDRIAGADRYLTNAAVLEQLEFDRGVVIAATGEAFPDALAGSVLAAGRFAPILLVPADTARFSAPALAYLDTYRDSATAFYTLGGPGAVSAAMESFIRPGQSIVPTPPAPPPSGTHRVSLQFWDGYASPDAYRRLLDYVPEPLTDYVDILSPGFFAYNGKTGSVTYRDGLSALDARDIVALGQSRGARVVPFVRGDGSQVDALLRDEGRRAALTSGLTAMVEEIGADGIMIDFEAMADSTETALTDLMRALYAEMNSRGKLTMIAVASRTSATTETWNSEFNYRDLADCNDYIVVMTYDKHYTTSAPGPIAPLDWVRQVVSYAVTQIPSEKLIMGMPYYGRDWWWSRSSNGWLSVAFGWAVATKTAAENGADILR